MTQLSRSPQASLDRHRGPRLAAIAGAALLLSGCSMSSVSNFATMIDPYQRPGMWRPLGINEANLELQVARAADLVKGRGAPDVDGETAVAAVDRLRRDKMKPLPVNGISAVGSNAATTGSTAGGG